MRRLKEQHELSGGVIATIVCVVLAFGMLVAFCTAGSSAVHAQEAANVVRAGATNVSLHITNFGNGMTPVLPPFRNDPEGVTLSQNMYSLQPGGRQLRHGYVMLVDSTLAATACGNTGVDAMFAYDPAVGQRRLMYAIGGKWCVGNLDTTAAKLSTSVLVPYISGPTGDKLNWRGDSAWYSTAGARFLQHLQIGDTLSFGTVFPTTFNKVVRWIIDDNKVKFTAGGLTLDSGTYTVRRSYHNDSGITPFYFQYGNDLFTGTKRDRPQVIYPTSTSTYGIRPAGIADSVHVDALYFRFGDTSTIVRSWDTASDGKEFWWVMQVVDRNKTWLADVWSNSNESAPETFYFRFGSRGSDSIRDVTYRILGNTDTSLFLAAMFLDTATNRAFADTTARVKSDTTKFKAGFVGGLGYIFSTAGNFKTVYTGVNPLRVYAGGAVLVTDDSLNVDSLYGTGGMYFVRPLDNMSVPVRKFLGFRYRDDDYPCGTPVVTPSGWTLLRTKTWTDRTGKCLIRYTYRYPLTGQDILIDRHYVYSPAASRYQALNRYTFFPLLGIEHHGAFYWVSGVDTTYFYAMSMRSGQSFDPGAAPVSVDHWEIVKADLPMWGGMTEFRQQLYAWGDTTAPGTMNRSKANVPGALGVHAWSGNDDILIGDNSSKAVVWAGGYDDQLVVGEKDKMFTTVDGVFFSELSGDIGMTSSRGTYLHNKDFRFGSDDGVYSTQRRDFSGYSVQKISTALDPIFNKWGATEYGPNVVPFTVNRALMDQSILTFNKRDQHDYFFFAEGTSTYNNRCLTYDVANTSWDGYFTIGAGAAISARFHDTTRLLIGSPTGPVIYAYDYNFSDAGTAITGELRGSPFYFQDQGGWPISTKLQRIKLLGRATSASVDTVQLIVIGDVASDTFLVAYNASSIKDSSSIMYSAKDNLSVRWQYKLRVKGKATGSLYQPHRLDIDFIPVWRDQ